MNRKPSGPPKTSWEFFSSCIYYLGKKSLTSLFQRGERQIERWAADPSTTSGSYRNPVDRYEILLNMLMEKGKEKIAQTIVSRQADIVGCELNRKNLPIPDKETLEHEVIDDLPSKVNFDNVLLNKNSTKEECRIAMDQLIIELKENYVKKCMDNGWEP